MKTTHIAYFDILGFKDFINYNKDKPEEIERIYGNIMLTSQLSTTEGKFHPKLPVPDIDQQKVNCLHVSDSIIFWTDEDSLEDFKNIFKVCQSFVNRMFEPIRGCLNYGDISFKPFSIKSKFYNSSLLGKGLIEAYELAECLEFSGCVLHENVINRLGIDELKKNVGESVIKYDYPTKDVKSQGEKFAINPFNQLIESDRTIENIKKSIEHHFTTFVGKESIDDLIPSARRKLDNTKIFYEALKK